MAALRGRVLSAAHTNANDRLADTLALGVAGANRRVQKWNVVAVWSWNLVTDTCAICRNNLHEPSIEYQASQGIIEDSEHAGLSIAWGEPEETAVRPRRINADSHIMNGCVACAAQDAAGTYSIWTAFSGG